MTSRFPLDSSSSKRRTMALFSSEDDTAASSSLATLRSSYGLTPCMMPPEGVRRIDPRTYSPECVEEAISECGCEDLYNAGLLDRGSDSPSGPTLLVVGTSGSPVRDGRSHGWRMVKDEAGESPVRFLEHIPLEGVAKALRSHSRRSQKASEVYSPSLLKLVRCLVAPLHILGASPMYSWSLVRANIP